MQERGISNFKTDLSRGHAGEALFGTWYPELERLDGRQADFRCPKTGDTYEIKTDSYTTQNFFMERWSDKERGKAGGAWQSAEKGVKYYVYLYPKLGLMYIFTVQELLQQLEPLLPSLRPVNVRNSSWNTVGYLVNRSLLTPYQEVHFEPVTI